MKQLVKILIADNVDLSGAKKLSRKKFFIKSSTGISNDEILRRYSDYDVLAIRSTRKIDSEFLGRCNFKIIATFTTGTDHIDTAAAKKRGIKILSSKGSNAISAAEHSIALLLCIEKQIFFSNKLVRSNRFGFYNYERRELAGRKIGIVGFGKVGSRVGKFCRALGMKVYANDIDENVKSKFSSFEFRSLDFILKNCDYISIHIPLNKKNYHFFSKEKLKKLNHESILINTSRGDVIDEEAMIEMLLRKKIGFAGLDVFSNEPNINKKFLKLDNVILTNHIAGKTVESRQRISEEIFSKLKEINSLLRVN